MGNGWTGGQYSLARFALGTTLAIHALRDLWVPPAGEPGGLPPGTRLILSAVAAVAAGALAVGWRDRVAALVLALLWIVQMDPAPGQEMATTAVALLLGMHAAQPAAPFGSWDARGRIDPGSAWSFRRELSFAAWILLALAQAGAGLHAFASGATRHPALGVRAVLQLAFGPLALLARFRPVLWLASLALQIVIQAADLAPISLGMAMLHLFTFDPAWVPRRSPGVIETLFYDGSCGLCHRAVRFLLAEDPQGAAFRFAPLGSDTFLAQVPDAERARLPDSLVLATADGRVLTRSAAVRHLMERLGGIWRALAVVLRVVPMRVQDAVYDTIARIRHRLFARPKDACPLLPPHLRARFLA